MNLIDTEVIPTSLLRFDDGRDARWINVDEVDPRWVIENLQVATIEDLRKLLVQNAASATNPGEADRLGTLAITSDLVDLKAYCDAESTRLKKLSETEGMDNDIASVLAHNAVAWETFAQSVLK